MNIRITPNRWWDWLAAAFLGMAIFAVATRLSVTHWTESLGRVQMMTMVGMVIGILLGISQFSSRLVRVLGFGYAAFLVPWIVVADQSSGSVWSDRVLEVAARLTIATGQFSRSQAVQDSILFIVLMAILFWLLGMTAGYYLVRHGNVWAAILPAGVSLLIINHYDPGNPSSARLIGSFIFFALLLISRVTYLHYQREWQRAGVSQSAESHLDLGRAVVVLVVVLFLLSWNVPAMAQSSSAARQLWTSLTHPWESLRNRFSDAVASLESNAGAVSDFYGDELKLGSGTSLGNAVIFSVKASRIAPMGTRFYWRARSYDRYNGGPFGWATTISSSLPLASNDTVINYPEWEGREEVEFTFFSQVNILRTLYTGPAPLWSSRTGKATIDYTSDGFMDVITFQADPPVNAGESYQTRSWLSEPTSGQLRASGSEYPIWVTEHYLQLPVTLPNIIRNLAVDITRGIDNPYDKAVAITEYLRANITYSDTVEPAPQGMEPMEWFLFETKAGYCNYYATAEVLMLRSIGIPARLAVGFAQGQYDVENQVFTVSQREAHAWPEVFFNGIGWVEFEPTVSQPSRIFNSGEDLPIPDDSRQIPDRDESLLEESDIGLAGVVDPNQVPLVQRILARPFVRAALWMIILTLIAVLAFLGWRTVRARYKLPEFPVFLEASISKRGLGVPFWLRKWVQHVRLSPLQKAYQYLNQALRRVGHPAPPSTTPVERAHALGKALPPAMQPAHIVVEAYDQETYSPRPASQQSAQEAGDQIRRLSLRALLDRWLTRR